MATTLDLEQAEQRRWKLRPNWSHVKVHNLLLEREFKTPVQQTALEAEDLRKVIGFAVEQVPYYRAMFEKLGITADNIRRPADLPILPPLNDALLPRNHEPSRSITATIGGHGHQ